jgi:hypothetical protein
MRKPRIVPIANQAIWIIGEIGPLPVAWASTLAVADGIVIGISSSCF